MRRVSTLTLSSFSCIESCVGEGVPIMQHFTPNPSPNFSPTMYFGTVLLSFISGIALSFFVLRGPTAQRKAGRVARAFVGTLAAGEEMKMVLVVRKDLKMTTGKIAAQCSHAAVAAVDLITDVALEPPQDPADATAQWPQWLDTWRVMGTKKVALRVDDEETLLALAQAATKAKLPHYMIQDAGRTQIAAGSRTVLAVGPAPASRVDEITGQLKVL
jgi:PTH2 family peptidyl-tRNA hydrolase